MPRLRQLESTLLFLSVLLIPTQLGRHFWPSFSYIFSLPVDYLSPTLYFWDLIVVALIIVWMLNQRTVNKLSINTLAVKVWLIFLLSQIPSLVNLSNISIGLIRLEQYLVVGLFGVYIASQPDPKKAYLPLFLAVLFEAGLAVLQLLLGHSVGFWILGERSFDLTNPSIAKFNWLGQLFLRPYGTFSHPNVLAAFMVVSLLLLFTWRKRLFIWLMVAATVTTFISFSRTAVSVLIVQLIYVMRKRLLWLALMAAVTLPFLIIRYNSIFNFDYLSIVRREELASNAWQFFQTQPLIGIGLNNFIPQTAGSSLISGQSRFLQPVHNIFLLELAETGLLGLVGFLFLLGSVLWFCWQHKSYPLLFAWVVIIYLGMFDHYWLTLPQGIRMLGLVFGLTLSLKKV